MHEVSPGEMAGNILDNIQRVPNYLLEVGTPLYLRVNEEIDPYLWSVGAITAVVESDVYSRQ